MTRITADDTMVDAVVKLAQGNPGAAVVVTSLLKHDTVRGYLRMLDLDMWEIYGPRIWLCYKDLLGEDLEALEAAIDDQSLLGSVKARSKDDPQFAYEWEHYDG